MQIIWKGVLIGLGAGAVLGGATFGPIGAVVGVAFGAVLGASVLAIFAAAYLLELVKREQQITCPASGAPATVMVDPRRAVLSTMVSVQQRVIRCSRFDGSPRCEQPCAPGLAALLHV